MSEEFMKSEAQATCPNCNLPVSVSIAELNRLWSEGSKISFKCKKCGHFFNAYWDEYIRNGKKAIIK